MNITFNPYNSYTTSNRCNPRPQAFTGKYDNFCTWVGKNVSRRLFDNGFIDGIAGKVQGKDNAIKFFLIGGSALTSGVYMQQTLINKKMDKDRKKTLAVNQFLTFLLSTAGALLLDKHLKTWWDKKKDQFFDLKVPNAEDIRNSMKQMNEKIKLKNEKIADADKEPLYKLGSYLEKFGKKHFLNEDDYKAFMTKYKGFGELRSIIVFAMVYRFLVPLMVTKPANFLCDKYLAHKKAKDSEKLQQAELKPQGSNIKTAA